MGDSRRFSLFADRVAANWRGDLSVADVAGGKGMLQAELRRRGFQSVESWDRRRRYAHPGRGHLYRYGYFDYRSAPGEYGLVVGMHPDGGTDHVVSYAVRHRVPFAVCPCCVIPSATRFASRDYVKWCDHLARLAETSGFSVNSTSLPMGGRSLILLGYPPK